MREQKQQIQADIADMLCFMSKVRGGGPDVSLMIGFFVKKRGLKMLFFSYSLDGSTQSLRVACHQGRWQEVWQEATMGWLPEDTCLFRRSIRLLTWITLNDVTLDLRWRRRVQLDSAHDRLDEDELLKLEKKRLCFIEQGSTEICSASSLLYSAFVCFALCLFLCFLSKVYFFL